MEKNMKKIYIYKTESLCVPAEINTTLLYCNKHFLKLKSQAISVASEHRRQTSETLSLTSPVCILSSQLESQQDPCPVK